MPSHMKVEGCTHAIEKTARAEKEDSHSPGSDYTTFGQYALAPHYNIYFSIIVTLRLV